MVVWMQLLQQKVGSAWDQRQRRLQLAALQQQVASLARDEGLALLAIIGHFINSEVRHVSHKYSCHYHASAVPAEWSRCTIAGPLDWACSGMSLLALAPAQHARLV